MKTRLLLAAILVAVFSVFVSCTKDDDNTNPVVENAIKGKYIINYGNYTGTKSSISLFDTEKDEMINNYYSTINDIDPVSNYQYAYSYEGKVYFMGNNVDKITYVDNQTFVQTENGISNEIVKPRCCVANGNTLYVSCWGGDVWVDNTVSYIAKVDLTTMAVSKIALPGGPEGLVIANGKLYAALNYIDKVASINLENDEVSLIDMPTMSTYFIKDKDDNLYVSIVGYYGEVSDSLGLGYINTTTDKLENVYPLSGISSSYGSQIAANSDLTKLYAVAASYNAIWELVGSVAEFDMNTKSFASEMFVEGIVGINGVSVDAETNNVMVLKTAGADANGSVSSYKKDGTFIKEYTVGIAPGMLLTVE
ncbi:MAG: hypothetical protein JEZ09_01405 [Salinivirgaceae bacterium]|nr:hypothetical protein [Salinivirgaceae bacterium]